MKRILTVTTILVFVIGMAGGVFAATLAPAPTVPVTASVTAHCKAGIAGSVHFDIDPSLAGPITAAPVTDATVFCSKGAAFTVTATSLNKPAAAASCAGAGITGTVTNGLFPMDYTFTCSVAGGGTNAGTGNGFGAGTDIALGIAGSIPATSYQNAPIGNNTYTDTITLTITY